MILSKYGIEQVCRIFIVFTFSGRNVQTLIGHTAAVYSLLSMNSDNNNTSKKNVEEEDVLWSGSADRTIRLWFVVAISRN